MALTIASERRDSLQYLALAEFYSQQIYDFELLGDDLWIAAYEGLYRYIIGIGEGPEIQGPRFGCSLAGFWR